jgi:4-diphosphocytidyl-2-C-methyl-D-erythritol kinase
MVVFPNAKINIGLRIVEKRSDGFHNIETVFYPVDLKDAVEFILSADQTGSDQLTLSGISTGGSACDNLILKAVARFRREFPIPYLKIHLHKVIPVGAGLGGGSSDATRIIKSLNCYFMADLSSEKIKEIVSELGSDCSFFLENKPVFAEGRGEILKPVHVDLGGYWLVLLNPGIHVGTREAFENCIPQRPDASLEQLIYRPVDEWRDLIFNDFEDLVFREHPIIGHCKEALYNQGAVYSSMSGSGSSVYGLFDKQPVLPQALKQYLIFSTLL